MKKLEEIAKDYLILKFYIVILHFDFSILNFRSTEHSVVRLVL